MFSCQRSRALLAAESNSLIDRFGKYHSARPQPKRRAGEGRRVPIMVGEGAARRAGNRKGPALEEQARGWAKKKPLKFISKIRGLSFVFGGAGGGVNPFLCVAVDGHFWLTPLRPAPSAVPSRALIASSGK